MSQAEVVSAKFALLGFGDNLPEAIELIQKIAVKAKPLYDGATFWECLAFYREIQPEINRLRELYHQLVGATQDETTVDDELESLMAGNPELMQGREGRPVINAIKFAMENWQLIVSLIALL